MAIAVSKVFAAAVATVTAMATVTLLASEKVMALVTVSGGRSRDAWR